MNLYLQFWTRLPIVIGCWQFFTNATSETSHPCMPIWSLGTTSLWVLFNNFFPVRKPIVLNKRRSTTSIIRTYFAAYGPNGERNPISVHTRAYIYFMQNLEAHDLVSEENCLFFSWKWFLLQESLWIIQFHLTGIQSSYFASITLGRSTFSLSKSGAKP